MTEQRFVEICRGMVAQYNNEHMDEKINPEDVYVVWNVKVLQNYKALLGTPLPDNKYFEITYNGDKKEFYFDAYLKECNKCIKFDE